MKKLKRNELFRNVSAFLAERGVELKDGSLTGRIRQGCDVLTDAVNLAQSGLAKAKAGVGAKVEHIRQVVHEKTAPQPAAPAAKPKPARPAKPAAAPTAKSIPTRKTRKPGAGGPGKPEAN